MQRKGWREKALPPSAAWRGGGQQQDPRCLRDLQIIQVFVRTSLSLLLIVDSRTMAVIILNWLSSSSPFRAELAVPGYTFLECVTWLLC